MAKSAKISKEDLQSLVSIGLKATAKTTEDEAKKMLQEFLKGHDINSYN